MMHFSLRLPLPTSASLDAMDDCHGPMPPYLSPRLIVIEKIVHPPSWRYTRAHRGKQPSPVVQTWK